MFKAAVARTLFMSILLGLLYWQLPNDQFSIQSVMGVLRLAQKGNKVKTLTRLFFLNKTDCIID